MKLPEIIRSNEDRVRLTCSCRDSDIIPKVERAGEVVDAGRRIQIMHNGVKVIADCYYGSWMTEIIRDLRGHHEPQEELIFDGIVRQLPSTATMFELGGFWSYYSLWFLNSVENGRSIVVEPDPSHLNVGKKNAELNNRLIEFVHASVGANSHPPSPFQTESCGTIYVAGTNVETLMRERTIEYLDILHCDTQGAETSIIESCGHLFKEGQIGFCVVSTHSHHISGDPLTHQKCLAMIQDFGGRVLAEHDVQESFSGDGLIAAYFGKPQIEWTESKISRNRYSQALFRNPLYDMADATLKFRTA